MLDNQEF